MNIDEYLRSFEGQKSQEEKEIAVVKNLVVEEICVCFEKWFRDFTSKIKNNYALSFSGEHQYCVDHFIKDLKYTSKDVRDFSISLKKYETEEFFKVSGVFLSALINRSDENDFEICVVHLNNLIDSVGMCNTKNVTVMGDLGEFTGDEMRSGKLTIHGNVKGITARKGGEVFVYGKIEKLYLNLDCETKIIQNGEVLWPGKDELSAWLEQKGIDEMAFWHGLKKK